MREKYFYTHPVQVVYQDAGGSRKIGLVYHETLITNDGCAVDLNDYFAAAAKDGLSEDDVLCELSWVPFK